MALSEELHTEVRHLVEAARAASDPELKLNLATRSVELSQRAELIEEVRTNPELLERYIKYCQYKLASGLTDRPYREIIDHFLLDLNELLAAFRLRRGPGIARGHLHQIPRTGSNARATARSGKLRRSSAEDLETGAVRVEHSPQLGAVD